MFDYNKMIEDYAIDQEDAQRLMDEVKQEFPDDEMMMEIHLLRALKRYAVQSLKVG